jgi:hypothetical protein
MEIGNKNLQRNRFGRKRFKHPPFYHAARRALDSYDSPQLPA